MSKNYYKTLGIDPDATEEEVKKAYRRMAQKYHPDKEGGDKEKYLEVSEAYEVLSTIETRSEYDKYGCVNEEYLPAVKRIKEIVIGVIKNTSEKTINDVDIIYTMNHNVKSYLSEMEKLKQEMQTEINKLSTVRKKISKKHRYGSNIFSDAIKNRIGEIQKNIDSVDKEIKLSNKMLEILEHYEYEIQIYLSWEPRLTNTTSY